MCDPVVVVGVVEEVHVLVQHPPQLHPLREIETNSGLKGCWPETQGRSSFVSCTPRLSAADLALAAAAAAAATAAAAASALRLTLRRRRRRRLLPSRLPPQMLLRLRRLRLVLPLLLLLLLLPHKNRYVMCEPPRAMAK